MSVVQRECSQHSHRLLTLCSHHERCCRVVSLLFLSIVNNMKTNLLYFREAEISVCHLLWICAPQFDQLDSKSAAEGNTSEAPAR